MQRILLPVLLAVVLVPIARTLAAGQDDAAAVEETKKEILKFEDERNQAILKRDTAVLDRMYSDGITWVMSNGDLLNKAQVLANIKSGNQRLFSMKHYDTHLHVFGDTVVLTTTSVSSERYRGKMITVPRRFTNVYIKRNGQWQVIIHTVTPLAGHGGESSLPVEGK